MKSSALPEFWTSFEQLPAKVQKIARKNFVLWQKEPGLKSLGFKRIKHDLWSVRAGSGFFARWQLSTMAVISGFGLGRMTNTKDSCVIFDKWRLMPRAQFPALCWKHPGMCSTGR